MKGNYLWPAMWGSAFNDDDTLNPVLADEYGIVMGTSHHEPLVRAHDEWRRYGKGLWNYDSNAVNLQSFWKKALEEWEKERILFLSVYTRFFNNKILQRYIVRWQVAPYDGSNSYWLYILATTGKERNAQNSKYTNTVC